MKGNTAVEQPEQFVKYDDEISYHPNSAVGLFLVSILLLSSIVLIWIGFILTPEHRSAMDGLTLLLFTVIPIRIVAWTSAAVVMILAYLVRKRSGGARGASAKPTLVVSQVGITLATGERIPWQRIQKAQVVGTGWLLRVSFLNEPISPSRKAGWLSRFWFGRGQQKETVVYSAFDLGAAPSAVAKVISEHIERRHTSEEQEAERS